MKSLEEKKLLVKMAKMLGQPVDQALVESIAREEKLAAVFFGEKKETPIIKREEPKIPILKEDLVEEKTEELPAETGVDELNIPDEQENKVKQTAEYLDKLQKMPASKFKDTEMEAIRKTVAELLNRVNTLSFGGGGTGIVRIWDADDLDRSTAGNDKVVKYRNDGWFYMDTVTGLEDFTYGSFYDTTNQFAANANTPYEVSFNTTDISKNHYIRNNTEIVANVTGVYNYQFSVQFNSTTSALDNIYIWVRKNGTDIPNSATILSMSSNKQYIVAAWNFFIRMNAGDHMHLMWAVTDTRISIVAPAATSFCPAVPSVIMTVSTINT